MKPLEFTSLINWIYEEYYYNNSIFDISKEFFYIPNTLKKYEIFGKIISTPIGPAAGPHTQLAQNIISSYITGGRFFELKTVQVLDDLQIPRPCIDAEDECYNVEWSQELKIDQSFDEYLKAYLILHLLKYTFNLCKDEFCDFVFNISVGYDLKGIQSEKVDNFIENCKNLYNSHKFIEYRSQIFKFLESSYHKIYSKFHNQIKIIDIISKISEISPQLSNSVTLSTMHGCPSEEIEEIGKYLLEKKKMHTLIKLNPTLLGYDLVREILDKTGFRYLKLDKKDFDHDLKYEQAIQIIKNLSKVAKDNKLSFGIKLTNTLPVFNHKGRLPEEKMYLSGKGLFYLSYELLKKLKTQLDQELDSKIIYSYSGGITKENVLDVYYAGAFPITVATDLLKPGGYTRLKEIAEKFEQDFTPNDKPLQIRYLKSYEKVNKKLSSKLPEYDCYVAPCQFTCPISQKIPLYIELTRQHKYKEAFEVIIADNPLPNITSYICDHKCQFNCTLKEYGEPVSIREIKKIATENGFYYNNQTITFRDDIKVAIIGAGPSGLSAAYFLARNGIKSKIFEKEDVAGGTVRYIIPEFRIDENYIQKDIDFVKSYGVEIEYGVKDIDINKLTNDGYNYVFVAIGAEIPKVINLQKEKSLSSYEKILTAIDFLKKYNQRKISTLGKNVVVIGGGNSAMDSARVAKRVKGVENVYLVYRRTVDLMPADLEEFEAAVSEGVLYRELLSPVEFKNGEMIFQKMKVSDELVDGRMNVIAVENEFEKFDADFVILAIGEEVDEQFLHKNYLSYNRNSINTNFDNVFIGGDARRGPATVVEAIEDGKKFAMEVLSKLSIENKLTASYDFKDFEMDYYQVSLQRKSEYAKNDILEKCLLCNVVCNRCVDVCPNRANIVLRIDNPLFKDKYQIIHLNDLCNDCGNCETFCPHQGKPYKDKLTYFKTSADFHSSTNPGFYFDDKGYLIVRSKDETKAKIVAKEFQKWLKHKFWEL